MLLTGLKHLKVNDNRSTTIPDTIVKLVNIGRLSSSYGLKLANNLLTVLPPEVISGFGTDEILCEIREEERQRQLDSSPPLDALLCRRSLPTLDLVNKQAVDDTGAIFEVLNRRAFINSVEFDRRT